MDPAHLQRASRFGDGRVSDTERHAGGVVAGTVHWPAGAALMAGGFVGGVGGATVAQRLPEPVIRWCVIAFASGAAVWCFLQ